MYLYLFQTPIGKAIEAGDVDAVNRLVKDGENILFRDRVGTCSNTAVDTINISTREALLS